MTKRKKKNYNYLFLVILMFGIFYTLFKDDESFDLTFVNNMIQLQIGGTNHTNNTGIKDDNNYTPTNFEVSTDLYTYFIDVGQADSILIKNNNEYALIDAGNNSDGQKLVTYLKSLNIDKLKYVIGTHPHEDHIGGLDDIINNFDIEKVYMSNAMTTTKTYEDVLLALKKKSYKLNIPKVGDTITVGETKLEVLASSKDDEDLNKTSIVYMLYFGDIRILLTGDAPSEVEKTLLDKDIKADVLKVGHHGSRYSSSTDFLNKVSPKYSIISLGAGNTYNHPHKEALARLEKIKTTIYRTDEKGTIILHSNGKDIDFNFVKTDTNG